ncbi:MAG: RNA polymerase factor sigma-54 [Bacteroidales bacterium]|nr:RNA polymerase factor sigma-54 [Bacteroidales bacterium]
MNTLKQEQKLKLSQGLSPLQIQTIKMLEYTRMEVEQKILKEIEENPVLDEVINDEPDEDGVVSNVSLSDYPAADPTPSYKFIVNNQGKDLKPEYNTFAVKESFHQSLMDQLGFVTSLNDRQMAIARFIVGSIDDSGYLRRDLLSLSDDIAFRLNIDVTEQELEQILGIIQQFEPAGVGARDLKECLLLQLKIKEGTPAVECAIKILEEHFESFTKKHYDKISERMGISEQELKEAIGEILKLNPRPGGQIDDSYTDQAQQVVPDFIVENKDGELVLEMPRLNVPELRINSRYDELLRDKSSSKSREDREVASFIKHKIDTAKWFVEAIKQRQNTLRNTMQAIMEYQHDFFVTGEETSLRPMVLRNIAEKTNLDISTISRVVNSKYVQTPFGVMSLKFFFSEGLTNESGEEVSTREIKKVLSDSIEAEDKSKPLTDDELVKLLSAKGYKVARRTVAKYRDQMNIPIARLRREI